MNPGSRASGAQLALGKSRPRCVEGLSEPPIRALNQEIDCRTYVSGESHFFLLSGSTPQPCPLGQGPVVPRPELDPTPCWDESGRRDRSCGPLAAGRSRCSCLSHSALPHSPAVSSQGSEAESSPPGTPICIRTVATLLDTLVRSNGDFPLYPFLFTGINSFDRDSLLHPSVCGEWEESISV